jgi:predicted small lipoprotein YifL
MSARTTSLSALVVGAALVVGLSACGSGGPAATPGPVTATAAGGGSSPGTTPQVCRDLAQTMSDVSQKGLQQVPDPARAEQTFRDGAATVRQKAENADGDVRRAANKVADEFEELGDALGALASRSTAPPRPDLNAISAAAQELQQACS